MKIKLNEEIKNTEDYLKKFKSENTRKAALSIIKKLGRYIDNDLNNLKNIKKYEIDLFVKKELNGKSETTISNLISRLKDLCEFYDNGSAKHLNLNYVKTLVQPKKVEYLSPYEVYKLVEGLLNWQDKALVILTYIGLYDNDFETIKNLREDQFKGDRIELDNGEVIKLNSYCSNIIDKAIKETFVYKYMFSDRIMESVHDLKDTKYIIKVGDRKDSDTEVVPTTTLKKRFDVFGRAMDIEGLSAIMIKNSSYLYNLVKLECETNLGFNINQVELMNYAKENNMRGSIGKLNLSKKAIRDKIIREIIEGKDIIHQ